MACFSILEFSRWSEVEQNPEKHFHQNKQDIYFTPEYYQLYEDYGDGQSAMFCLMKKMENLHSSFFEQLCK